MTEYKLYKVYVGLASGGKDSFLLDDVSFGRNKKEALSNYLKLHSDMADPKWRDEVRFRTEKVQVPGFRITLTPLEQKVSS